MKLTERFIRMANNKLHYSLTVEDPSLYFQP